MNKELIQKLFSKSCWDEQAEVDIEDWCDVEKFAELIIKECCQFENSYGGEAGLVARHYSRKIRKHFGVEL
jgi:hypothetical protein